MIARTRGSKKETYGEKKEGRKSLSELLQRERERLGARSKKETLDSRAKYPRTAFLDAGGMQNSRSRAPVRARERDILSVRSFVFYAALPSSFSPLLSSTLFSSLTSSLFWRGNSTYTRLGYYSPGSCKRDNNAKNTVTRLNVL